MGGSGRGERVMIHDTRMAPGLFKVFCWCCAVALAAAMGGVFFFLLGKGLPTLSMELVFGNTPYMDAVFSSAPVWDGLWPAITGTLSLVILAVLIAFPLGLASGIYLAEFAKGGIGRFLNISVDLLTGIPSVLMGLFGFLLILFLRATLFPEANTCLALSATCIAFLILPYVVRTTQRALEEIPLSYRLAGASLGFTERDALFYILLPSAAKNLLSAVALSIGRAAEDTAVILMTGVVANASGAASLFEKYEALPFTIYYLAAEHTNAAELSRAYGAALILMLLTTTLMLFARLFQRAFARKW